MPRQDCPFPELVVEAGPAERNALRIATALDQVRVRDDGAALSAGTACAAVNAHEALCDTRSVVVVRLGDDDDRLAITGDRYVRADGGTGKDELLGGAGPDALVGGAGRDALFGRGGDDLLSDGSAMRVADGDLLDGGPGADTVGYEALDGVRIDLLAGTASGRLGGAVDRLVHVENAFGGPGDDVVVGDDGPNTLSGGGGRDVLAGRGGDDRLHAHELAVVEGGPGNDVLGSPGARTRLTCPRPPRDPAPRPEPLRPHGPFATRTAVLRRLLTAPARPGARASPGASARSAPGR